MSFWVPTATQTVRWMGPLLGSHRSRAEQLQSQHPLLLRVDEIKMLIKSTQTGLEMHQYISILSVSAKSIFQKQYWN